MIYKGICYFVRTSIIRKVKILESCIPLESEFVFLEHDPYISFMNLILKDIYKKSKYFFLIMSAAISCDSIVPQTNVT